MIPQEADWLREQITTALPRLIFNLGSSTLHFRTKEQPFIEECFRGFNVVHVDKKKEKGVDVVCDLESEDLQHKIIKEVHKRAAANTAGSWMAVLSNVLEHVENKNIVIENVAKIGCRWLYVSVPYIWPVHHDPIDNNFRPCPRDLVKFVEWYGYKSTAAAKRTCERGSISVAMFQRVDRKT